MRKGAAGTPPVRLLLRAPDAERRVCEAFREPPRSFLVEPDELLVERRVRREVAALRHPLSVHGHESRLELSRVEAGEEVPVLRRDERDALALALDCESCGNRLHPAGGEAACDLLPQDRRHLVAVQPVEDPPRLLGVHESLVDDARVLERSRDRFSRDLVKHHAANRNLRFQHLHEVPGDRFSLSILIRREQELVRVLQMLFQLGDDLLLARVDDVVRLELLVDVHAERAEALALGLGHVGCAVGEVADVPDAGFDRKLRPEVARDRARLRRALDDDESLGHGATP